MVVDPCDYLPMWACVVGVQRLLRSVLFAKKNFEQHSGIVLTALDEQPSLCIPAQRLAYAWASVLVADWGREVKLMAHCLGPFLLHRVKAALRAISFRCSGVKALALALAPFRANSWAYCFGVLAMIKIMPKVMLAGKHKV